MQDGRPPNVAYRHRRVAVQGRAERGHRPRQGGPPAGPAGSRRCPAGPVVRRAGDRRAGRGRRRRRPRIPASRPAGIDRRATLGRADAGAGGFRGRLFGQHRPPAVRSRNRTLAGKAGCEMSDPVIDKLARFTPADRLDRDDLLFRAGRASAPGRRTWMVLAGILVVSQIVTLSVWFTQPGTVEVVREAQPVVSTTTPLVPAGDAVPYEPLTWQTVWSDPALK